MRQTKRLTTSITRGDNFWGTAFVVLPILGFFLFGIIPLATSVYISMTELHGFSIGDAQFVGFQNFYDLLHEERFYRSIFNTLYSWLAVPISICVGVVVSALLRNIRIGSRTFKIIFFIPFVCSTIATSTMWKWFFDQNYGIANGFLSMFGSEGVGWLTSVDLFMPVMILTGVWSQVGLCIVLYSAALTNLNPAYEEAAKIDGAGRVTIFFKIVLPGISATTFYLFIMNTIAALQDYPRFQVMGGEFGGPGESGLTMVFYLYNMGFKDMFVYGMGMAAAMAWFVAVIIGAVTVFNFKMSSKWVSE